MILKDFRRLTRNEKCPVCQHKEWCLVARDGQSVICQRVESPRRFKDAGWYHKLGSDVPKHDGFVPPPARPIPEPPHDWERLARECVAALMPDDFLADELGVSPESLIRLRLGWHVALKRYTFPMFDDRLNIIGIRTRSMNGYKACITGSHNGLFIPRDVTTDEIWIVEGPTDCAAMLSIGLNAIGRPNNVGGSDLLRNYLDRWRGRNVYIIPDRDDGIAEKQTVNAATNLAAELRKLGKSPHVFRPPHAKDVREWINSGVDAAAVRYVANAH